MAYPLKISIVGRIQAGTRAAWCIGVRSGKVKLTPLEGNEGKRDGDHVRDCCICIVLMGASPRGEGRHDNYEVAPALYTAGGDELRHPPFHCIEFTTHSNDLERSAYAQLSYLHTSLLHLTTVHIIALMMDNDEDLFNMLDGINQSTQEMRRNASNYDLYNTQPVRQQQNPDQFYGSQYAPERDLFTPDLVPQYQQQREEHDMFTRRVAAGQAQDNALFGSSDDGYRKLLHWVDGTSERSQRSQSTDSMIQAQPRVVN